VLVVRVQWAASVVPDAPHGGGVDRLVLEPVHLQYLVVSEVERTLHAAHALRGIVACILAPTGLAPDEVRHKRPTVVAEPRRPLAPHLLVPVHDLHPVAVQGVGALEERLVFPPVALRHEQVYLGFAAVAAGFVHLDDGEVLVFPDGWRASSGHPYLQGEDLEARLEHHTLDELHCQWIMKRSVLP
ncbi:hypothetical protein EJB05_06924, partial [Eragrostis curvula]